MASLRPGPRARLGALFVLCVLVLLCALAAGLAWPRPPSPALWSDPRTWGGHVPVAGQAVTIAPGKSVLLDLSPPPLGFLNIQGELLVRDEPGAGTLTLQAASIQVGGRWQVGEPDRPLRRRFQVTLGSGQRVTAPDNGLVTVPAGGSLELWGTLPSRWTRLSRSALAGSRTLHLASPVNWKVGDVLALAPTGFDLQEAERVQIAARSPDGRELTLRAPLRHTHFGQVTEGVDERAEVGVLTRTIAFTSVAEARRARLGGGLMVLAGGTLKASGAAFSGLGRAGQKGFYPVHFHRAGRQTQSFVADSSFHDTFNRCLSLHGTQDTRLEGNVTFNAVGHCFFLEDGTETGNRLLGNLAVQTRGAAPRDAILETDVFAAAYWITNPDNVLRGNVAAGAEHSGFWYSLPPQLQGDGVTPEEQQTIRPRRTNLGEFRDNVAHSTGHTGLFVDNLKNPPGVLEAPNYSPPQRADFQGLTAYKNRRRGAWLRGTNLRLSGVRLADNAIGVTFAAADTELVGGVVVGESQNRTGPPKPQEPHFPLRGFEFYDGPVTVQDIHFAQFVSTPTRPAGALGALQYSPFFFHPASQAAQLRFSNAQPVYLAPRALPAPEDAGADGYRSAAFLDVDGSVTGQAGTSVLLDTPFLTNTRACQARPAWGAVSCAGSPVSLFVLNLDAQPGPFGPLTLRREDGAPMTLRGNPRQGPNRSFQTNLWANHTYRLTPARWPRHLRLAAHHLSGSDDLRLTLATRKPARMTLTPGSTASWSGGHLYLRLKSRPVGTPTSAVVDLWF
ncbi:G8 domain-containing protein [Deinococcus arcticus]|uniref:G8 domain-containing protein n=1 Tax=Deinococcus arcticus TaxID=2136176 RepID=A0A2T3WAI2_9DEIO|nr:G8 domain-containing protein [Deinococcus arcticus]PTA68847.1 hypothetical protein C8263_06375 [Deinococcus arcticus]